MRIFNKIINIALIVLVFLGWMFVNIDFSSSTGILDLGIEISQAEAQWDTNQATNNQWQTSTTENKNSWKDDSFTGIIKALNFILGVLMIMVSPIILFAWWLMSPDWVTGDIFGLRGKMYLLWTTVSNILYFVYAIMLIVIAIATIFNYQPYAYKSMLPRLFLGIILIPLTFWFVQFIISTATVVTATVLKIPQEMMARTSGTDEATKTFWNTPDIPKVIEFSSTESSWHNNQSLKTCTGNTNANHPDCTSPEKIMQSWVGIYSPVFVYAYKIFEIQNVKQLSDNGWVADVIKNVGALANKLVFNTILFFIFGLLTIAMVFILLMRGLKLWVYAIFSPLFTAKIVFKEWKSDAGGEMFDIKEFIGLAFVPAVMGLALSFGLIVVSAIQTWLSTPQWNGKCDMTQSGGCVLMTLLWDPKNEVRSEIQNSNAKDGLTTQTGTTVTTITFGELKFKYTGSLKAWAPTLVEQGWFLWWFGTIIVQFIALIFIWVAFIAAAKINKWVKTIIAPFESFGKSMAEMGKNSVKMIPLPWVGSVGGLEKANQGLGTLMNMRQQEKYNNSTVWQTLNRAMNIANTNHYTNNIQIKADMTKDEWLRLSWDAHNKIQNTSRQVMTNIGNSKDADGKINVELTRKELGSLIQWLIDASKDSTWRVDKKNLSEAIRRAGLEWTELGHVIYKQHNSWAQWIITQLGNDDKIRQIFEWAQNNHEAKLSNLSNTDKANVWDIAKDWAWTWK